MVIFKQKALFFDFGLSLKRKQHFQLSPGFKRVALENGPTFCLLSACHVRVCTRANIYMYLCIYIYIYIYIYITGSRKTLKYDSKFNAIDAIIRYSNYSAWF